MRAKGLLPFVRSAFSGRWCLSPFPVDKSVGKRHFSFAIREMPRVPSKRAKRAYGVSAVCPYFFRNSDLPVIRTRLSCVRHSRKWTLVRTFAGTACEEWFGHGVHASVSRCFPPFRLVVRDVFPVHILWYPCKKRRFVADGRLSVVRLVHGSVLTWGGRYRRRFVERGRQGNGGWGVPCDRGDDSGFSGGGCKKTPAMQAFFVRSE